MAVQPWDQLIDESDRDYALFISFRDLGPGRTIPRLVAQGLTSLAIHTLRQKAKKRKWTRRAEAWDLSLTLATSAKQAEVIQDARAFLASKAAAIARGLFEIFDDVTVSAPSRIRAASKLADLCGLALASSAPAPAPSATSTEEPDEFLRRVWAEGSQDLGERKQK